MLETFTIAEQRRGSGVTYERETWSLTEALARARERCDAVVIAYVGVNGSYLRFDAGEDPIEFEGYERLPRLGTS